MRAFSLNCMYLSGIHAGIQTAHSHDELTIKYIINDLPKKDHVIQQRTTLLDWMLNHKTIIVKNGGMCSDLYKVLGFLMLNDNRIIYPWAAFYEEPGAVSLHEPALTNITIVLPENVYGEPEKYSSDKVEWHLFQMFCNVPNMK